MYATAIVPPARAYGDGLLPLITQPRLCQGPSIWEAKCSSVWNTTLLLLPRPEPVSGPRVWPMVKSRSVPSVARTS